MAANVLHNKKFVKNVRPATVPLQAATVAAQRLHEQGEKESGLVSKSGKAMLSAESHVISA